MVTLLSFIRDKCYSLLFQYKIKLERSVHPNISAHKHQYTKTVDTPNHDNSHYLFSYTKTDVSPEPPCHNHIFLPHYVCILHRMPAVCYRFNMWSHCHSIIQFAQHPSLILHSDILRGISRTRFCNR